MSFQNYEIVRTNIFMWWHISRVICSLSLVIPEISCHNWFPKAVLSQHSRTSMLSAPDGCPIHPPWLVTLQLCSLRFWLHCAGVNNTVFISGVYSHFSRQKLSSQGCPIWGIYRRAPRAALATASPIHSLAEATPLGTLAESWTARVGRCHIFHTVFWIWDVSLWIFLRSESIPKV